MSTPFPFTQQHRMAPVIVSRRYHSIPNICTKYIPNELLQLNNARKNKTPLFSYSYDPYKKKKRTILAIIFQTSNRSLPCLRSNFVRSNVRLPFSPAPPFQAFAPETPPLYRYRDWLSNATFTTSNAEHCQHSNLSRWRHPPRDFYDF